MAPRPRSARWLAERFEVSPRTVERDIAALQQASVPIYAEPGRAGGYVLDRSFTLPPVNVTPAEAVALAVSLHRLAGTPFEESARSALHKVVAVMAEPRRRRRAGARRPGAFHRRRRRADGAARHSRRCGWLAGAGIVLRRQARLRVQARGGAARLRRRPRGVVPGRLVPATWAVRAFRLDRIRTVTATAEPATPRQLDDDRRCVLPESVRQLSFG